MIFYKFKKMIKFNNSNKFNIIFSKKYKIILNNIYFYKIKKMIKFKNKI